MKTPKQSITGNLTQQTGISQRSLATFLEIDHSLITHYYKGVRSLPTAALVQLFEMDRLLQQPAPLPAASISEKEKEDLLKIAERCRMKCYPLRVKLTAMQLRHQQAANTLQMTTVLTANPSPQSELKQLWLNLEAHKAAIKLKKNGWLQQRKLEIAIQLLEQEAALYESAAGITA